MVRSLTRGQFHVTSAWDEPAAPEAAWPDSSLFPDEEPETEAGLGAGSDVETGFARLDRLDVDSTAVGLPFMIPAPVLELGPPAAAAPPPAEEVPEEQPKVQRTEKPPTPGSAPDPSRTLVGLLARMWLMRSNASTAGGVAMPSLPPKAAPPVLSAMPVLPAPVPTGPLLGGAPRPPVPLTAAPSPIPPVADLPGVPANLPPQAPAIPLPGPVPFEPEPPVDLSPSVPVPDAAPPFPAVPEPLVTPEPERPSVPTDEPPPMVPPEVPAPSSPIPAPEPTPSVPAPPSPPEPGPPLPALEEPPEGLPAPAVEVVPEEPIVPPSAPEAPPTPSPLEPAPETTLAARVLPRPAPDMEDRAPMSGLASFLAEVATFTYSPRVEPPAAPPALPRPRVVYRIVHCPHPIPDHPVSRSSCRQYRVGEPHQ